MKDMFEYLNSEEGKESMNKFAQKYINERIIEESQIDRFHEKYKYREDEIIEKIFKKYKSKKYVERWHNRGKQPEQQLFNFLFKYAMKYGKEYSDKRYATQFTAGIYILDSYVIQLIVGQGSFVAFNKLSKKELKELDASTQ